MGLKKPLSPESQKSVDEFVNSLDDPTAQEQLTFMSRQAELLDEQGHDVSAKVMRDCMKVLARTMTERDQQTRFKYDANLRADLAEAALRTSRPEAVAKEFEQLAKFYDVTDMAALVRIQAEHIESLQAKLPPTPPFPGPQRVREG